MEEVSMRRLLPLPLIVGLALGTGIVAAQQMAGRGADIPSSGPIAVRQESDVAAAFSALPLQFEANRGQTDRRVLFLSRGPGYALFLTREGAVLNLPRVDDGRTIAPSDPRAWRSWEPAETVAVGLTFVDANAHPRVSGVEPLPGVSNYMIGNDPSGWITDVPHYARVDFDDLYEGVDLTFYGNDHGEFEFDFTIASGVDPSTIRLAYEGASGLTIDASGALVLELGGAELRQPQPSMYQWIEGTRREVDGRYLLHGSNEVGFVVDDYDPTAALVIDPVITYSTYLGGSADEFPIWSDIDGAGNFYVTGITFSPDFPTTPGSFQEQFARRADAFVTKLDPSGSGLVFSTYLGSKGFDLAIGLDVDGSGNVVVTGATSSPRFPTTPGSFQWRYGGGREDAFVTKLDATGSSLVFSTLLGGAGFDEGFIAFFDSAGNVHVEGDTGSKKFPTTAEAFQTSYGGGDSDGFVTKLNPTGSALVYSTYVGGSDFDGAHDGWLDAAGNFYIDGLTASTDFPTTSGSFQPGSAGGLDAFAAKVDPTGSALLYATYIGGSGDEDVLDMTIDSAGNAYVPGPTTSTDFPTTAGSFQPSFQGGDGDGYVIKLDPTGSAAVYSTYLGGSAFDLAGAIRVDGSGAAHVPGITASADFPTTVDAFQPAYGGGPADAFVSILAPDGSGLLSSSFLGGSGEDGSAGSGAWLDDSGNFFIPGFTDSPDFPTTDGAFQTASAGGFDVFLVKLALGVDASFGISRSTERADPAGPRRVSRPMGVAPGRGEGLAKNPDRGMTQHHARDRAGTSLQG
jgi:hypothetical protein